MGAGAGLRVSGRWSRRARSVATFLCLTVVAFWLFEGLCSVIWVWSRMAGTRMTAERLHTRYDRELGWVSIPDLSLPDLYGPGLGLTTNARGFRGLGQVEPLAPGARRVICSGDSFTLGYGVGDLETWCSQLGSQEPRLDAVNMGQGGYGVDQAYLWYKRDGRGLEHQAHVFAFITDDLRRMLESDFHGFGKPHLELEDGNLVARNVPVPRGGYLWPWLTSNQANLEQLRSYAVVSALWRKVRPPEPGPSVERLFAVLFAALEDMDEMNHEAGSVLLIAYLPTYPECLPGSDETLRVRLATECARRGLDFIDLTTTFADLTPADLDLMYLPGWPPSRHLSARGHRLVAETLRPRVRAMLTGPARS
jgi:hypothetical protein